MLWPDLTEMLQVEIGWRKETAELIARCRTIYYEHTGRGMIGWDQGNLRATFGKLRVRVFFQFFFFDEEYCNYLYIIHLMALTTSCSICVFVYQIALHPPKTVAFAMCIVGVQ